MSLLCTLPSASYNKVICALQQCLCLLAGNVVQSLTLSIIVPLTIAAFTLDLPYISDAPELGKNFIIGTTVLLSGLFVYNSNKYLPALKSKLGSKDP